MESGSAQDLRAGVGHRERFAGPQGTLDPGDEWIPRRVGRKIGNDPADDARWGPHRDRGTDRSRRQSVRIAIVINIPQGEPCMADLFRWRRRYPRAVSILSGTGDIFLWHQPLCAALVKNHEDIQMQGS